MFCSFEAITFNTIDLWIFVSDGLERPLNAYGPIENEKGVLSISHVTSEDSGYYICYARNGIGDSIQKKVTLSVIGEILY